jgi:hypothetical protein
VIRTVLATGVLAGMLGNAPMQCSRSPDPDMRREDTAGDALWDLAEDFKAKGNDEARKQTLRFLVEKYPSNRHVPAAREELGIGK